MKNKTNPTEVLKFFREANMKKMELGGPNPKKAKRLYDRGNNIESKAYSKYQESEKTDKDKKKYLKKVSKSDRVKTRAYKARVGRKVFKEGR